MINQSRTLANLDWLTVFLYTGLTITGLFSIYSVEHSAGDPAIWDFSKSHTKQFLWLGMSLIMAGVVLAIDERFYEAIPYPLFGLLLLLILFTAFFGVSTGGTTGWINLGFFRLQPSEFGKMATALALAKFLSAHDVRITALRDKIIALLLIFVPIGMVLLQGDVGTAMVYSAFVLVLFRQGLPPFFLYFPLWLGVLFIATLLIDEITLLLILVSFAIAWILIMKSNRRMIWGTFGVLLISGAFVLTVDYVFENVLQHHHKQRINVLLGKELDMRGAGYNIHQSLIAVGSGGIQGQGYLNGTQTRYNFIPEQNTDFIFSAVAEEHGFLGSLALLAAYLALLLRLVWLAEFQEKRFIRIFGYGVVSVLFIHLTINIAMTIGLFPVVGIPLPFISYGGSSLMAFTLMLFIFLKMDAAGRDIRY